MVDVADSARLLHEVALVYAAQFGWPVVPVRPETKRPLIDDWPKRATTDPAQITRWWQDEFPGASIGILLGPKSGLFVVDVDDDGGLSKAGKDTLLAHVTRHGQLPVTPTVITPRGGLHFYFRWPGFNPTKDGLGPDVDVLGEGRFVVAPPSIHPNGASYAWDLDCRPSMQPVAEAPDWLLELVRPPAASSSGPSTLEPSLSMLLTAGWILSRIDAKGQAHVTRPNKDPREGSSATVFPWPDHHVTIWTTSVDGARTATPYYLHELAALLGVPIPDGWSPWAANGAPPGGADADGKEGDGPRIQKLTSVTDLLDADEPEYDWLVPGLLERGDRLIVTGGEGDGKSTLLRQLAFGCALGLDPLATNLLERTHEPRTVLVVDLENSARQLRREFAKLIASVPGGDIKAAQGRFFIESHAEGLALDDDRDRLGDRAWVEGLIEEAKPDLFLCGPIWKMLDGDANDEEPNRSLVKWIDRLRVKYDLTVALEAHTPHGATRPYGWSGWKRWPEFGFHLFADGQTKHWRGQREERAWPTRLARSGAGGGSRGWLWVPDPGTHSEPGLDPDEQRIAEAKVAVIRVLQRITTPLTKNQIVEKVGKRRTSVLAAISRLTDTGALLEETFMATRDDGKTYSTEGFVLAPQMRADP
jgi:hypothetical protein